MKIKLEEGAIIPQKAHPTDAAYDLYAFEEVVCEPYSVTVVRTGIRIEQPEGWFFDIRPRSSYFRKGIDASGIIDADYRGEILVMLQNHTGSYLHINKGERMAQMLVGHVFNVTFEVVDELSETERGSGGFGSTGK